MGKRGHRFESEVHLGLLAVVFVLLLLNVASNYVVHKARLSERERAVSRLRSAALATSRLIQKSELIRLQPNQAADIRRTYDLNLVLYVPMAPPVASPPEVSRWLASAGSIPEPLVPAIRQGLLEGATRSLLEGEGDSYCYLYPMSGNPGKGLLLLAKDEPQLAFLEGTGRIVLVASIILAALILGAYLFLTRLILSPFRKIRKEAINAGRSVDSDEDEVEAMVEDYRLIISELRDKEAELLRLNREIQGKADSLEQFNQYLLTSMDSGIVTVGRTGKLLSINRAAEGMLAVDASEHIGQHYWPLLSASLELVDGVSRALECGKSLSYREIDFQRSGDETPLRLGVAVSLIADNSGGTVGASILLNDLTELASLRAGLEASGRLAALGEMAAGLAHQLRNSLGAISGYGNLVRRRIVDSRIDPDCIDALMQEVNEAGQLIRRFLDFARPLEYNPEPIEIGGLISEVIESFSHRDDCSHINIRHETTESIDMLADSLLLKQALANLVDNAVAACGNGPGVVELRAEKDDNEICILVRDTGCGIPSDDLKRVFTPFFSSRPSGSGLGLSLANKIVDLHGGKMIVRSKVAHGTTFTIRLPAAVVGDGQGERSASARGRGTA